MPYSNPYSLILKQESIKSYQLGKFSYSLKGKKTIKTEAIRSISSIKGNYPISHHENVKSSN